MKKCAAYRNGGNAMRNKLRKLIRHILKHPNDKQADRDLEYVMHNKTVPSKLRRRPHIRSSFELLYGFLDQSRPAPNWAGRAGVAK